MRSALENAFTHAPIGMALVDMAGRVLRVNDAMCRITSLVQAGSGRVHSSRYQIRSA